MPDEQPHWRGINHLALVTTDMDATVRFYHSVLGARLVA
ncbi:MAG: VOC family protein, partial [Actinomycetota bacterium]|nr:VOC family protein [Actinomycetota bacterium]